MKKFSQLLIKSILVVAIGSLASCSSEKTVTQSKKVRSGFDRYNDGYDIEKGEHGMMQSGSSKVSQYDSKRSNIRGRDFSGKDYNKESYRKERWGGSKDYASKKFTGNTDGSKFKHSPHYVNRNASAQANGQYATDNESQYNTGKFATGRANEGSASDVKTSSSGYVSSRNNAPEPRIMSKDDYNDLSITETRRMLGR